ncbi:alpha-amylase [Fulvivirga sp. 29W222]|uniref:Alpha-amylase n=1 Tax=Fulvivirga marina TaxID=2494733 RepID=A0A937G1W8_9BACT|nr:alpha-amylase family glycosyl hydrolase [Fulvivirga marina]MBL6449097.1 alpha-amylase [Fulvivirga marina]
MKVYKHMFLALVFIMAMSCQSEQGSREPISAWPQQGITYEIFVQSFYDSDGDSIGDINGMTQKLDYLQDLGAEAVWLMPIMPSPSYHKYDVTDYKGIHPDYGTMDDFKGFVQEAHNHNIKVVIDLIINHTSSEHPWFKSATQDENSQYRNYYVWADKDSIADQLAKKEVSFDSDNITQWHAVNGDTTAEHYYGFFYGGMPDLNYDNAKLRAEIYDIGRFWLQDVGVDGFRLDAAKHIYPDDRANDNHEFWREFRAEMEKVKPDVYLVGEVWANTDIQAPYAEGFSALFNFDLAFSILETLNKEVNVSAAITGHGWTTNEKGSIVNNYTGGQEKFKQYNPEFAIATFLSNHDQNRVMSVLNNDMEKAKAAASILLTLPGAPYLYYGEEIGMRGLKPDEHIREPFLWEAAANDKGRAQWIKPQFTTDESVKPLSEQMEDPNSLFNHYKKMIALRRGSDVLTYGDIEMVEHPNPALLVFKRTYKGQELLVVHNVSGEEQSLEGLPEGFDEIYKFFDEGTPQNSLNAYESTILN